MSIQSQIWQRVEMGGILRGQGVENVKMGKVRIEGRKKKKWKEWEEERGE